MSAESRPHPRFLWTDPRVQALPLSQKRVLEYAWTGPDVTSTGVTLFEAGVWQARVGEIAVALATCLKILERNGDIVYSTTTGEVWVCRWFSFHRFDSWPARVAFRRDVGRIADARLRDRLLHAAAAAGVDVEEIMAGKPRKKENPDESVTSSPNSNANPNCNSSSSAAGWLTSASHPLTAAALAVLASQNHSVKPDSNVGLSLQTIKQALLSAAALADEDAAAIVNNIAAGGGWLSAARVALEKEAGRTQAEAAAADYQQQVERGDGRRAAENAALTLVSSFDDATRKSAWAEFQRSIVGKTALSRVPDCQTLDAALTISSVRAALGTYLTQKSKRKPRRQV